MQWQSHGQNGFNLMHGWKIKNAQYTLEHSCTTAEMKTLWLYLEYCPTLTAAFFEELWKMWKDFQKDLNELYKAQGT